MIFYSGYSKYPLRLFEQWLRETLNYNNILFYFILNASQYIFYIKYTIFNLLLFLYFSFVWNAIT